MKLGFCGRQIPPNLETRFRVRIQETLTERVANTSNGFCLFRHQLLRSVNVRKT
ncbi:hypothetical protein RBSWK_04985 [Rhodopirellula baltica SWK14]|uniref:Uncharacterized protein n=1 Tax=Rhodopirellula baltica SWK14 TaxID=993516 RepID=L7CBR3_RHOBT|nr:hypothetical protein RBSWK_04985 [Rhodopirellula baltica SWK14]